MPATDTPAWLIKQAVIATLEALGLTTDAGGSPLALNVVGLWADEESNVAVPAILVIGPQGGDAEDVTGGDTHSAETVFPLTVALVDRAGPRDHDREPEWQDWRHKAMNAFRDRGARLALRARVPGVKRLDVVPRAVLTIRGEAAAQGAFLLRVTYCEPRVKA